MIITSVVVAGFPIYFELALSTSVTDPIETRINGLGAFLFDGLRSESYGSGVVHLHFGGKLRMIHFLQCGSDRDILPTIDVVCSYFGFCRRSHDIVHDLGDTVDWAVRFWYGGGVIEWVRENIVSACADRCPQR